MKTICQNTGKVIYNTRTDAMDTMVGLRARLKVKSEYGVRIKRRVKKPGTKRIYYCEYCCGFHLTSWSWWPFGTKNYLTRQQQKRKYETMFTI